MAIARKAVESIFILMQFSRTRENKSDFSPVHVTLIKENIEWKYQVKNGDSHV